MQHAATVHKHKDSQELRQMIKGGMKNGTPPLAAPQPQVTSPPTTVKPKVPGPAPLVQPDTAKTNHQNPVDIDVTANDSGGGGGTLVFPITILDTPSVANITLKPDGHTVHYVPNNQKNGQYVFHYQVCNTGGGCATGAVTVTIT